MGEEEESGTANQPSSTSTDGTTSVGDGSRDDEENWGEYEDGSVAADEGANQREPR